MRNTYIENNDFTDALHSFCSKFNPLSSEIIETKNSLNRVTEKAIFANVCDPIYNAAAMDGIAVCSKDTLTASEINPLTLNEDQFAYVNTGNPVKYPYDSVIMIEDVIIDNNKCKITSPSHPYQHIRCIGETIVASEMVLSSKRKITPFDIGGILASGNETISVVKQPVVTIIPTGNEMVESVSSLKEGKLIESNSHVFSSLIKEYGGIPIRNKIISDDANELEKAIQKAIAISDMVIINAGSSAGTKDFTKSVISKLGTVFVHGLAIKPGKPTILGVINNKPVIGVPGYPVSAYIVMEKVVKPVIETLLGLPISSRPKIEAKISKRVVSSLKHEEFIRVALGYVDNDYFAIPLERGAAAVMSMIRADGLISIPKHSEGIEINTKVSVELYSSIESIKNNLVIVGSHDVIVDIIGDSMPIVSAHVGSMGGILALKNNSAHIAPIHLLDENGEYNISYVKKYFEPNSMALIKGVGRVQGLLTEKSNPNNIQSIHDISKGFSFANRQNGSGTRLLFDYLLKKNSIDSSLITGYEKEYTTHLAVAAAVKNKIADCGIAVLSAANIMDLDFTPIANEEYDFLVPVKLLNDPRVINFIHILKSKDFAEKINKLGGYTTNNIGEVIIIR
ncbi:MAG: molybdopterin biosynthesis protein [Clostridia bacterium]|nr:molybdopterin biosynthesis protein [Clostridia bacterium]